MQERRGEVHGRRERVRMHMQCWMGGYELFGEHGRVCLKAMLSTRKVLRSHRRVRVHVRGRMAWRQLRSERRRVRFWALQERRGEVHGWYQ